MVASSPKQLFATQDVEILQIRLPLLIESIESLYRQIHSPELGAYLGDVRATASYWKRHPPQGPIKFETLLKLSEIDPEGATTRDLVKGGWEPRSVVELDAFLRGEDPRTTMDRWLQILLGEKAECVSLGNLFE